MTKKFHEAGPRPFEFERDSFAFANQTVWEYHFDEAARKTTFSRREPKPDYALRCFVLTRAARLFFYHARFDLEQKAVDDVACRRLVGEVLSRNPRQPSKPENQIVIPGWPGLKEFSAARESLLKATCGGAWRSYVVRSHWRMVFPISREHQARTAESLRAALQQNRPPVVHLVKFPALTINHSMIVFAVAETGGRLIFQAYDPNIPKQPVPLTYDRASSTFSLSPNHYWIGGELDIIEIYRNWLM